jgi:hypothetical protein
MKTQTPLNRNYNSLYAIALGIIAIFALVCAYTSSLPSFENQLALHNPSSSNTYSSLITTNLIGTDLLVMKQKSYQKSKDPINLSDLKQKTENTQVIITTFLKQLKKLQ